MLRSVYDVLYKKPKLKRKLKGEKEALAQAIVASGRMRLDADNEANFTRLISPEDRVDLTFTMREMADNKLRARAEAQLLVQLSKKYDTETAKQKLPALMEKVKQDLTKKHPVKKQTELMMARALVLCNSEPVIRLIHKEQAEIFISFGQSIGELMDVARWERAGANSGLQAVGAGENSIYVSCGGHPFLAEEEYRHTGDGPAALARFMIIAAQETGHHGDMIRDASNKWIGRHSAVQWYRQPAPKAAAARNADHQQTDRMWKLCQDNGLNRVAKWESDLQFFRKVKVRNARQMTTWLLTKCGWIGFKLLVKKRTHMKFPKLQRDKYPAQLMQTFFADMLANLAPDADVYRRKDPREEEAVMVIEAVARVPQQVVKWGHEAVRATTPKLYEFYYHQIVPACEKALR